MRFPRFGGQSNNGVYGGFGSKPADKAWTPSSQASAEPTERVPKRFRRLRLRRRRVAHMGPDPDYISIPIWTVIAGAIILGTAITGGLMHGLFPWLLELF
jgi:hypothetical protein